MLKVVTVIGARPQFIKAAVVSRFIRNNNIEIVIHTGQHYNANMSDVFFDELDIPNADYNLEVGSCSHGRMTGHMLEGIETIILNHDFDVMLVYGDTNSTLAGALAASKLNIPVVHIEAGLRSYNMKMPEEQNRVLTDHISTLLLCPTDTAVKNLQKEGIVKRVYNTGDVMYDSILHYAEFAEKKQHFSTYLDGLIATNGTNRENIRSISIRKYYLATIHRAENTDTPDKLKTILSAFNRLDLPVLFPIHPRTLQIVETIGLRMPNILFIEPVRYLEMLTLTRNAKKVLTDSGGLQKEAYFLDTPCVTLRDQTEWVETLEDGWNILASINEHEIITKTHHHFMQNIQKKDAFGDGHAAQKIVELLEKIF